eukprot:GHUV01017078.1.p1 GENE.GHUV01017078.1~~GHUV01017078.1.p1  ORF type:complete len:485 (+),score=122.48 GHUV01017078.1:578-2032(+)
MCLLMHCISSERPLCCTRWIQAVRTHLSPCAFCCLMLAKCWLSLLIDSPDWPQLTVVRQVEREVAILRQLHHENLVGCLFVADQGNKLSIVMDWAGDSLRTHRTLTQPQQYNEAVARHMVYQLTHALVYLHQKGIIHRDIKPDNIGVHVDHRVQLFDWGEAITLDQIDRLTDKILSKQVGVAGTPLFMPPEVLNYLTDRDRDPQGAHHLRRIISTKLDVWGLGTVLFFLLAGRDIFINDSSWELENLADIANASCGVDLPLGVEASYAARDFLRRCLERDPLERASAKELMQHPWLMGASSLSDMEAFYAAQQRHDSTTVHRTALLSVLAESFSSEGDEGDDQLSQPISLGPEAIAAATAAVGGFTANDALSASLALASGVSDVTLGQEQLQQGAQQLLQLQQGQQPAPLLLRQSTQELLELARSASHHKRVSSMGSKGHLAAVDADSDDTAVQLQRRSSGEAVCEVRLRMTPSGSSLSTTAVH